MIWIFEKLPTARTVIVSIFWLQIVSAILVFWLVHQNLLETRFGTQYMVEEIDNSPSELKVRKYKKKVVPKLKQDDNQRPNVNLPSKITDNLKFSIVNINELGKGMLLSGSIGEGDALRFIEFIKNSKDIDFEFVALQSPGGLVEEALIIGEEIRERELITVLPGNSYCYSACPYIMAGGTERIFSAYSLLGVHQHYFSQNPIIPVFFAVQSIQEGQAKTFRHLKKMGINTDIMEHILSTPPREIYVLNTEELEKFNFATEIVEPLK